MPFYANPHPYAIEQEQQRQDEAATLLGEPSAFILWWNIEDHQAGIVDRCSLCFDGTDGIAAAYGQASSSRCPGCFGTTFEGGIRGLLYRPTLWNATEGDAGLRARGVVEQAQATIQTVSDFSMRIGDVIVRRDKSRWRVSSTPTREFTTGYEFEGTPTNNMRGAASVVLLDPAAPGFLVEVDDSALANRGWYP